MYLISDTNEIYAIQHMNSKHSLSACSSIFIYFCNQQMSLPIINHVIYFAQITVSACKKQIKIELKVERLYG